MRDRCLVCFACVDSGREGRGVTCPPVPGSVSALNMPPRSSAPGDAVREPGFCAAEAPDRAPARADAESPPVSAKAKALKRQTRTPIARGRRGGALGETEDFLTSRARGCEPRSFVTSPPFVVRRQALAASLTTSCRCRAVTDSVFRDLAETDPSVLSCRSPFQGARRKSIGRYAADNWNPRRLRTTRVYLIRSVGRATVRAVLPAGPIRGR